MAKQQTKRRRKRYQPGSAYAGDVKPPGIFRLFGDVRLIRGVFILMALALVGGGFAGLIGSGTLGVGSGSNPAGFVLPDDEEADAEPQPGDTTDERRYAGPPAMSIDAEKGYVATITTELGDIQVELFADQVPQTVNNFVFLARAGFYDGLTFHYVAPGYSAQAGDPTGRGTGGPGYELPPEAPGPFEQGILGMVNASQFFISLTDSEDFEEFTPFGRVISGLEVAEQVRIGTRIQTIEILEE